MSEQRARLTGALLVAVGAVCFALKGILVKLAYRHGADAVTLLALRMVFSAPLFLLVWWWAARGPEKTPLSGADWRAIGLLGLLGYYLASYFDFLGLQHITAALERLLLFLNPTFVVLISAAVFGRRITGRDVVAILLSYLGIAVVFGHDLVTQPGNVALGSFLVLISAILYATYLVGSGRVLKRVGTLRFSAVAGLVSSAGVLAHYFVVNDPRLIVSQPPVVYGYSIAMAVIATVLPILLTSEGIRRLGASHASIVASVGPIATIFLGAMFLGEAVTWLSLLGAALVLAGVLIISLQAPSGKKD